MIARLSPGSRVTICGSVTRDVVLRHGQTRRQIGGTVWFAGTTLAGLGLEVRVMTRLAAADQVIADAFHRCHIETQLLPTAATTTFHNIYGSGGIDDRRQRVETVAPPLPLGALEAALASADLCYLGALHPGDLSVEALTFLQGRRAVAMAMDVQGFTRRIDGTQVRAQVAPELAGLLAACCVVKASAFEACLITGVSSPEEAARRLAEMTPDGEILVTSGGEGVLLALGQTLQRLAAVRVEDPDPTGAGDIFLSSYLGKRLGGAEPMPAAEFAVAHTARRLSAADRIVRLAD